MPEQPLQHIDRRRGPPRLIAFAPLTGLLLTLILMLADMIPLGIPGEWVWPRQPLPADVAELAERLFWPFLAGMLFVGTAIFGELELSLLRLNRLQRTIHLLLLTVSTLLWHSAVLQSSASPHRELRPLWILYDRSASGYYLRALEDRRPLRQFLAEYESEAAKGDVLHAGTHPPGLLLLNRAVLAAARSSRFSGFIMTAISLQPVDAVDAFRRVETEAGLAPRLTDQQLAALALTSFGSLVICSCLPLAVYLLLRQFVSSRDAWRSAALAAVIPCIDLFQPRSDVLYPVLSILLLALLIGSLLPHRLIIRLGLAGAGGILLFGSLLLSLAHLPTLAVAFLFAILYTATQPHRKPAVARTAMSMAFALATFAGCVIMLQVLTDCSLLRIWHLNLGNHAGFYQQYPRTWWKWLLVNPLEMGLATGLPVMLLVPAAVRRACSSAVGQVSAGRPIGQLCVALTATWLLLWLSGKNMGEAARLWCFAAPWWMVCLAAPGTGTDQPPMARKSWRILLFCQSAACVTTTALASGYHLLLGDTAG